MARVQYTICPRDCYDSCALSFEQRCDGYVVRGRADHAINRGDICGKCAHAYNAFAERGRTRLRSPLRNVGTKGQARFAPISWDEALDRIAQRLGPLLDQNRGAAIVHSHYDGARGLLARQFPLRLLNAIGATGVVPGSICHTAGLRAFEYVFGSGLDGIDPREFRSTELIVLWGVNPFNSSPHAWRHWIAANPDAMIVRIDPLDHDERPRPHRHLRPQVGTDAVLAFGVMRVLLDEGLIDHAFLREHATGFDALESVIRENTATSCAERCGVPVSGIVELARSLACKRTIIWLGMGLQRQSGGGNIFRSIAMLPVLTGNLFRDGAGIVYLNGVQRRGLDQEFVAGSKVGSPSVGHAALAGLLADRRRSSVLVTWNNNIAVSNPDLTRLHDALKREDLFVVCADTRLTRTCGYADIILPAADFIEYDDLVYSYFFNTIGAQRKLRDPLGDSLPNQEIFRRLAGRLGLSDPSLYSSDRAVIDETLRRLPGPITFDELAQRGTWHPATTPQPQFAGGAFATQTGRIEIASPRAEVDGCGPTPRPIVATAGGSGPFRLLTPASFWRTNSSFSEMPHVSQMEGTPAVLLHSHDAARLGIADGQSCEVFNEIGSVRLIARVSDVPPPGSVVVYKCRGEGLDPEGVEINRLIPAQLTDMGDCVAFQGIRVDIRPLTVAAGRNPKDRGAPAGDPEDTVASRLT